MSRSLKTIQTLSKVGRILSKIAMIASIVGGGLCLAGILSVAMGATDVLKWQGITIHGLIEEGSALTSRQQGGAMAAAGILCAAEAVIAGFASAYFRHELDAGTPFTEAGAQELLRLGILTIALTLGAQILGTIVCGVFGVSVETLSMGNGMLSLGVAFLLLSVIFRYGAEIRKEKAA